MKFQSQVYTAASGSVGGLTYSHNRGGMYTRGRAIPVNPNTPRQQTVRAYLASGVVAWSTALSQAQRDAWDSYAANTPVTDTLGATIHLTGQQMFVRSYVPGAQAGRTIVTLQVAPTSYNLCQPAIGFTEDGPLGEPVETDKIWVDLAGTNILTEIHNMASPEDDGDLLIQFSPDLVGPGRSAYRGPYQLADVIASGTSLKVDWSTALADLVGGPPAAALVPGARLAIRIRRLTDDNRLSATFRSIVTVTEGVT